ncbi:hypothetical protein B0H66DRAFT_560890 [Apodospora peruviana]|uniref:Uncharacterized protein n=1 Tax=Apodospora peruviana TaxID=516989 RepID=A0AAE0I0K4_9PEZI|nr:hypothetical protein B0H66DRAFT_560890 [Apodospora peruviana]
MASKQISGGLNPEMVYRPLTPPSGNTYLRVDESDDPMFKFRTRLAWLVRCFMACLTFGTLLGYMIIGRIGTGQFAVGIFVELWFILIWHLVRLLPSSKSKLSQCLPKVSCQVGDCSCVINGDDGDDEPDHRTPRKTLSRVILAFGDLAFGVTLLAFAIVGAASWGSGWYYGPQRAPVTALSIILAIFMIVVSFLSFSKVYQTFTIEYVFYTDGTTSPIRLQSPEGEGPSRRDPVSIVA